ncbi:unnamed protein product [Calicophoron daubneyi]|uniref:MAM domain-containing protein n=1 Tax=Calicophoron daubneyi TaxID=300641 RepID=A0AAV2TZN7_CALDB
MSTGMLDLEEFIVLSSSDILWLSSPPAAHVAGHQWTSVLVDLQSRPTGQAADFKPCSSFTSASPPHITFRLYRSLFSDRRNLLYLCLALANVLKIQKPADSEFSGMYCPDFSSRGLLFPHHSDSEPLWISTSTNKPHSFGWLVASVDLHDGKEDFKLILEGTIPAGYPDARICVDNITSYTEPCSALQKASAPIPVQWTWGKYFALIFIVALVLGLTIPVLFLVILIFACRRRHHSTHSSYTNNKLFSTNLWYYIGGKEICDDPTGFRGSASLLRSTKPYSPSAIGTLLHNQNGQQNTDVMDLPDVVIPGGRVVSFNYAGNTLGPSGTMRRMQPGNVNMQSSNCFNTMGGPNMLTNLGTVSTQGSGTPATTVGRSVNGQQSMMSDTSASVGPGQPSMLMTQSVATGYNVDPNTGCAMGNMGQFNTCSPNMNFQQNQPQQQPFQLNQQQQPMPQQQQQPYVPPQTNMPAMPQAPIQQPLQQQHSVSVPCGQPVFQNQISQPILPPPPQQIQQPVEPQQQQQCVNQQPQCYPVQQQQPQQQTCQQTQFVQQQQPVPCSPPQQVQQTRPATQPTQLPPPQQQQQQQQHQGFASNLTQQAQQQAQMQPQPQQQQQQPQQQRGYQPVQQQPIQNVQQHPQSHPNSQAQVPHYNPVSTQQGLIGSPCNQPVAAVSPTTRMPISPTPVSSLQSDSLTEADQQAAMAALMAATEESEPTNDIYQHANGNMNFQNGGRLNSDSRTESIYMDSSHPLMREDHPPPGYDEAIGLVVSRPNNCSNIILNNANNNGILSNTMAKPAVPVPTTNSTPPPALPPRRVINGMGLEDVEDAQPTACMLLAERYGLPVAEI